MRLVLLVLVLTPLWKQQWVQLSFPVKIPAEPVGDMPLVPGYHIYKIIYRGTPSKDFQISNFVSEMPTRIWDSVFDIDP